MNNLKIYLSWKFLLVMFIVFPANMLQRKNFKKKLPKSHILAYIDFTEDYACWFQDEVQTAYFSMTQVTLHPVVIFQAWLFVTI